MHEFGWSIEYTLGLTLPQFLGLSGMIGRIRADAAIDGIFRGYCAGKYGGKAAKDLLKARGAFFLGDHDNNGIRKTFSREALERAEQRADAIIARMARKGDDA